MSLAPAVRLRARRVRPAHAAAFVLAIAHLPGATAGAQELIPHLRPDTKDARLFVDEALARSAVIRELDARLNESDVTVYVRFRAFSEIGLEGRLRLVGATALQRYVLVELACVRPRVFQIATFAHELFHALEIASTPWIVNNATLAAYYERAGIRLGRGIDGRTYETQAARDTAALVTREMFGHAERTGYGTRTADSPRP